MVCLMLLEYNVVVRQRFPSCLALTGATDAGSQVRQSQNTRAARHRPFESRCSLTRIPQTATGKQMHQACGRIPHDTSRRELVSRVKEECPISTAVLGRSLNAMPRQPRLLALNYANSGWPTCKSCRHVETAVLLEAVCLHCPGYWILQH